MIDDDLAVWMAGTEGFLSRWKVDSRDPDIGSPEQVLPKYPPSFARCALDDLSFNDAIMSIAMDEDYIHLGHAGCSALVQGSWPEAAFLIDS